MKKSGCRFIQVPCFKLTLNKSYINHEHPFPTRTEVNWRPQSEPETRWYRNRYDIDYRSTNAIQNAYDDHNQDINAIIGSSAVVLPLIISNSLAAHCCTIRHCPIANDVVSPKHPFSIKQSPWCELFWSGQGWYYRKRQLAFSSQNLADRVYN
jgi:hypothetical protein